MNYLRQSTASQEITIGPFLDDTDGKTAETALTIANTDLKIWKAGAITLASKNSGGATHISGGIYYAVLDATDTDTLGSGSIYCQVSGALPCVVRFTVLPANVFDALVAGSDLLQVDTTQVGGTTATPTDDLATATALSAVGSNVSAMVNSGVLLASTQGLYAPAKAGDAMNLTADYNAAKAAASATSVAAVKTDTAATKTVTDTLSPMISAGAFTSAALANAPSSGGSTDVSAIETVTTKLDTMTESDGSGGYRLKSGALSQAPGGVLENYVLYTTDPVTIGTTPTAGVLVTAFRDLALTQPVREAYTGSNGTASLWLEPGTYYLRFLSDGLSISVVEVTVS